MQQCNQHVNQANKSIEFEAERPQKRAIRSTSHSRLCSSTKSVKNIATSKSIENGKETIEKEQLFQATECNKYLCVINIFDLNLVNLDNVLLINIEEN